MTWTVPNQHQILNQVVLQEMQRVLEHLCNMSDLGVHYMLQV